MHRVPPPPVSVLVIEEIEKAAKFGIIVQSNTPDKFTVDSNKKNLVARFLSLVMEHHSAILHLLKEGCFDGSAFALLRPLVDATYRAYWVFACASEEEISQILSGERQFPQRFEQLADQVESKLKTGGIFSGFAPHIKLLHGYTHGGLEQLRNRVTLNGTVEPCYADEEKMLVIKMATFFLGILAIAWCHLTSRESPENEDHASVIRNHFMNLYPSEAAS